MSGYNDIILMYWGSSWGKRPTSIHSTLVHLLHILTIVSGLHLRDIHIPLFRRQNNNIALGGYVCGGVFQVPVRRWHIMQEGQFVYKSMNLTAIIDQVQTPYTVVYNTTRQDLIIRILSGKQFILILQLIWCSCYKVIFQKCVLGTSDWPQQHLTWWYFIA